nr:hypothetical protein [Prauserella muralis]
MVFSGVVWTAVPAVPVRVTAWTRPSSVAMRRQVMPARRSADPDEEQGEPAEQHVGADAVFEPMKNGSEQQ